MSISNVDQSVDISFHGVNYVLSVTTPDEDTLSIELEQEADGQRWRGVFSSRLLTGASDVEDISKKTGNFKRFPVFVRMLLTALSQQSDSVFIDLLTAADLEMLKQRRSGSASVGGSSSPSTRGSSKRYLILTYAVEFDRVHYPLPLAHEAIPDPESLQRTIRRLRNELTRYRESSGGAGQTAARLEQQNTRLQAAVEEKGQQLSAAQAAVKDLQRQVKEADENRRNAETALEKLRAASRSEVVRLRNEVKEWKQKAEDLEQEIEEVAHEQSSTQSNAVATLKQTNQSLRARVRELTRRLALAGGKPYAPTSGPRSRQPRGPAAGRRARTPSPLRGARHQTTPTSRGGRSARSRSSQGSRNSGSRTRVRASATPPGGRFDPTAYVEARRRKIQSARMKRGPSPGANRRARPNSAGLQASPASARSGSSARSRTSAASRGSQGSRGSHGSLQSRHTGRSTQSNRSHGSAGRATQRQQRPQVRGVSSRGQRPPPGAGRSRRSQPQRPTLARAPTRPVSDPRAALEMAKRRGRSSQRTGYDRPWSDSDGASDGGSESDVELADVIPMRQPPVVPRQAWGPESSRDIPAPAPSSPPPAAAAASATSSSAAAHRRRKPTPEEDIPSAMGELVGDAWEPQPSPPKRKQPAPAANGDIGDNGDTSGEARDIDERLQALQSFLRAAKAGQPVSFPVQQQQQGK